MAEEEHQIINLRCILEGHAFDYNSDLGAVAIGRGAACTPCMDRLFNFSTMLRPNGDRPQTSVKTRKRHDPFRHKQKL